MNYVTTDPMSGTVDYKEPIAVIERVGNHTYRVSVRDGISRWGPYGWGWRVWGFRRAQRKARKVLAEYVEREARRAEVWEVRE